MTVSANRCRASVRTASVPTPRPCTPDRRRCPSRVPVVGLLLGLPLDPPDDTPSSSITYAVSSWLGEVLLDRGDEVVAAAPSVHLGRGADACEPGTSSRVAGRRWTQPPSSGSPRRHASRLRPGYAYGQHACTVDVQNATTSSPSSSGTVRTRDRATFELVAQRGVDGVAIRLVGVGDGHRYARLAVAPYESSPVREKVDELRFEEGAPVGRIDETMQRRRRVAHLGRGRRQVRRARVGRPAGTPVAISATARRLTRRGAAR